MWAVPLFDRFFCYSITFSANTSISFDMMIKRTRGIPFSEPEQRLFICAAAFSATILMVAPKSIQQLPPQILSSLQASPPEKAVPALFSTSSAASVVTHPFRSVHKPENGLCATFYVILIQLLIIIDMIVLQAVYEL